MEGEVVIFYKKGKSMGVDCCTFASPRLGTVFLTAPPKAEFPFSLLVPDIFSLGGLLLKGCGRGGHVQENINQRKTERVGTPPVSNSVCFQNNICTDVKRRAWAQQRSKNKRDRQVRMGVQITSTLSTKIPFFLLTK